MNTPPLAFIIEDNEDLSTIFAQALQAAGFAPEIITDGAVASARLAGATPHIVVLDLHLPQVEGTELLKQIRADPRLAKTRVVVVSADARLAEMVRDDANIVLIKPISFNLLRDLTARFRSILTANNQ